MTIGIIEFKLVLDSDLDVVRRFKYIHSSICPGTIANGHVVVEEGSDVPVMYISEVSPNDEITITVPEESPFNEHDAQKAWALIMSGMREQVAEIKGQ